MPTLASGDIFEDGPQCVKKIEIVARGRILIRANHHFLCAAAAGNQADAGFHQADIGFGCGVNFRGVQADFAAAAERHALRRGDDGLRRVLDGKIHVLELLHGHVQFVPLLFLRANEHQHQIGADGKIGGLIGDDHGVEIRIQPLDAFVNHGDQIGADGVHFGVKFAADHAIAEIDQAGAGIALDFAAGIL